ncbi:MAG: hypothetical protein RLZZ536_3435, partial [Planctomycetota bacterium]
MAVSADRAFQPERSAVCFARLFGGISVCLA